MGLSNYFSPNLLVISWLQWTGSSIVFKPCFSLNQIKNIVAKTLLSVRLANIDIKERVVK